MNPERKLPVKHKTYVVLVRPIARLAALFLFVAATMLLLEHSSLDYKPIICTAAILAGAITLTFLFQIQLKTGEIKFPEMPGWPFQLFLILSIIVVEWLAWTWLNNLGSGMLSHLVMVAAGIALVLIMWLRPWRFDAASEMPKLARKDEP